MRRPNLWGWQALALLVVGQPVLAIEPAPQVRSGVFVPEPAQQSSERTGSDRTGSEQPRPSGLGYGLGYGSVVGQDASAQSAHLTPEAQARVTHDSAFAGDSGFNGAMNSPSQGSLAQPRPSEQPAMSLDDLVQIALQCNPTLVQATMAVRSAQGGYVQAGLYPNPVAGYKADEIGNDGAEGMQGVFVNQEIVTADKLRWGRAVACHEVQEARLALEAQQQRVQNDVRAGYYETLLAQKRIEVNRQLVAIQQQSLTATQQLKAAAEVSEVNVLQAGIEAEKAQLDLSSAEDRHQAAWRRLAAVLGQPEMTPAALAGDPTGTLPTLTWEDSLARLLAQSPELGTARATLDRARCEAALQCAKRVPDVEVGSGVKYDTASRYTIVDVQVGMAIPVFNRNQGNILRAQAEVASAQSELRRAELELQSRLATVYQQYANARRRAEKYAQSILPHAQRSLELTQAGYRSGEIDFLTLLTTQRTFCDTSLQQIDCLEEFWARTVDLEGLLLRGGLQNPASPRAE